MAADLAGKVLFITGAARGIGEETARRAAARGAHVAAVGMEPERLEKLVTELGPGHTWAECDVTDQASLEAALQYSNILFSGAIAVWIVNLLAAALCGSGNVKVPALITLVGALIMIPLSPAVIFGFGPIPRLGIAGAGVAFNIYYVGALIVMLRYMRQGHSGLSLSIVPLQGRLFADILKVGLPTAFNALQTNLCVILVTAAVGLFALVGTTPSR